MSAHTPGPWEVKPARARARKGWAVVANDGMTPVAGAWHRADAQAISATLDLLAVVEEAIRLYGKPGGPWNMPSDPGGWIARAQDAVAKARGTMSSAGSKRSEGER